LQAKRACHKFREEHLMADEPLPFDPANLETMQVSAKTTRAMIALVAIFQDLEHGRLTAKDAKGRVQNEIQQVRKDCGDEKNSLPSPLVKECVSIMWGNPRS
jgi:hypothetical protein